MPATNSVNRYLSPFVFFASTPLSRVLEELIIPQLFEIFPKTLWNTRVQNCAHKKCTSFYLRSILIFLELELNARGSCRRLGFKLNLHKESLIMPLPKPDIQWFEHQIMLWVCLTLCTKRFISSHIHLGCLSGNVRFSH